MRAMLDGYDMKYKIYLNSLKKNHLYLTNQRFFNLFNIEKGITNISYK